MGSRESRATPVSGVRQLREHGPKCPGTAWDEPRATPSMLALFPGRRVASPPLGPNEFGQAKARPSPRAPGGVLGSIPPRTPFLPAIASPSASIRPRNG